MAERIKRPEYKKPTAASQSFEIGEPVIPEEGADKAVTKLVESMNGKVLAINELEAFLDSVKEKAKEKLGDLKIVSDSKGELIQNGKDAAPSLANSTLTIAEWREMSRKMLLSFKKAAREANYFFDECNRVMKNTKITKTPLNPAHAASIRRVSVISLRGVMANKITGFEGSFRRAANLLVSVAPEDITQEEKLALLQGS